MANSHTVEHGKTPFANCVVFEDLADEEWRESCCLHCPQVWQLPSLDRVENPANLQIKMATSETNTYNLNSLCLRKAKASHE